MQTTYERTDKIKETKFQQLTTKYEHLKLSDLITNFNLRLMVISNEANALGEPNQHRKISEEGLEVSKL